MEASVTDFLRGGGAAALNLDHCTYVARGLPVDGDHSGWFVQQSTIDNYSEWVAVEDADCSLGRAFSGAREKKPPLDYDDPDVLDLLSEKNFVAARRARRALKWKCMALRVDRLWTLTKRGRIETRDEAWALWGGFERYCSRRFAAFEYVVVIEPHKIDGYHIHFCTNRFFLVDSMRLWWHRVVTGDHSLKHVMRGETSPGNIHVGKVGRSRKLARYLGKYLSKDLHVVCRHRIKRFATSKNIAPPARVRWRLPFCAGAEVFHLRNHVEASGFRIESLFETLVAGRRLIWLCGTRKGDPPKVVL